MKKVKVLLDCVGYKYKPKTKAAEITNRLTEQHNKGLSKYYTIEELAENLGNGKTAILATYRNKTARLSDKNEIEQQQVLFLDIDNNEPNVEILRLEDVLKDDFILNNASFIYKSFSHTETKPKFRIAFILEEPSTDKEEIHEIYSKLLYMYKQADQGLKNTNRLFFGGSSGYEIININNTLNLETLSAIEVKDEEVKKPKLKKAKAANKTIKKQKLKTNNQEVYTLLRANNYEKVKEIINLRYGQSLAFNFSDVTSAITVLQSKIDMVEFLDLPTTNPFLDILHPENNPSASVFKPILEGSTEEQDFMLYKVFSESSPKIYDLVNLISVLTGLNSRYKAGKLLAYITGSEFVTDGRLVEIKESITFIAKTLRNDATVKLLYPNTYKIIGNINHLWYEVINIMVDYTTEDLVTGDVRVVNFLSHETLADKISGNIGLRIDKNKARRVVDSLVFLKMVKKLKDSEIPENLLDTVVTYKKDKGNRRRSNVYEIVLPPSDYLEKLELFCSELVALRFTLTSNLNGDFLYRHFGESEVIRIFPQFKTHTKETLAPEIENVLSKDSLKIESAASKYIMKQIAKNGYVLEKDVKTYLTKYFKKYFSDSKFKTVKFSIIENYNLERAKVNPELINKYQMTKAKPNMFCYIVK